jgi:hypothetical protein
MRTRQCIALMGSFEDRAGCVGKTEVSETVRCDSEAGVNCSITHFNELSDADCMMNGTGK